MNSSIIGYWFMKIAGVGFIVLGFSLSHGMLFPENTIVKGLNHDFVEEARLELIIIIIACFLIGYFGLFRFVIIICDDDGITITKNLKVEWVEWSDVSSIWKIPCTAPPVYRCSFNNDMKPIYFHMTMTFFVTVGVWSWDFTGFISYAKEQMKINTKS